MCLLRLSPDPVDKPVGDERIDCQSGDGACSWRFVRFMHICALRAVVGSVLQAKLLKLVMDGA